MVINETELLRDAYDQIQFRFPGLVLDSFKVATDVVDHRNFWKPPAVRTMLLAESHVYTTESENSFRIDYPKELNQYNLPQNFVRLVYCLAYGEQLLSPQTIKNTGTWQYWKIFAACASDTPKIDYSPVLKCNNYSEQKRILDKFSILLKLKEKGVWLVDCSSVALYGRAGKRTSKQKRDILRICWETYIRSLIEETKPKFVLIIGKRVGKIVESDLIRMGIPTMVQPQPQARLSSEKQAQVLQIYQQICNRNID